MSALTRRDALGGAAALAILLPAETSSDRDQRRRDATALEFLVLMRAMDEPELTAFVNGLERYAAGMPFAAAMASVFDELARPVPDVLAGYGVARRAC